MRNPITATWRALRRVAHPIEMCLLIGFAAFCAGLWLSLPLAFALMAVGALVIIAACVSYAAMNPN